MLILIVQMEEAEHKVARPTPGGSPIMFIYL